MSDNFGNLLEQFVVPLARNEIGHLVSGSVASIFYGGYKSDFYPSRNHPYFQWALAHAVPLDLDGVSIRIAPPEYVILWKLEFLRLSREDKHVRDIQGMLRVSGDRIDLALLNRAIEETGLQEIWKTVLRSGP